MSDVTGEPRIRAALAADAPALADLGGRLFVQTYEGAIPPEEMRAHVAEDFNTPTQSAEIADPDVVTLVVERAGELLGFAQIRRHAIPLDDVVADVELWRIYLDRSLHGGGWGRRLLAEVGARARAWSASGLWLAVWQRNPRAIAFYAKHGFVEVGHQEFHVGGELHCDLVLRASPDTL